MVGIYISSHPLDDFNLAMDHFVSISLNHLGDLENHINRELSVGGLLMRWNISKVGQEKAGHDLLWKISQIYMNLEFLEKII